MADIVPFPSRGRAPQPRYRPAKVVGSKAGITVRILSSVGAPHDLLVVLDGTADGTTTVAATPTTEMDVAEVIAHAVLASLDAADMTWKAQEIAWSR